ncbi:MAG: tetratricopeptide repeat protein [Steroidobacteraceae bacterium]
MCTASLALAGCAGAPPRAAPPTQPDLAAVLLAEIAAARNDLPAAAHQYASVAAHSGSPALLERAASLALEAQQPRQALAAAERWSTLAPAEARAHEFAGRAALDLYEIALSSRHFTRLLSLQAKAEDAGFARLSELLSEAEDAYAARRVADLLAAPYPASAPALRMRGLAQAAADDDASAVANLRRSWQLAPAAETGWALARALGASGQQHEALALANDLAAKGEAADRLQHASLLILLDRTPAAQAELEGLLDSPERGADALRLMGRLQLQRGDLEAAATCFERLVKQGHYPSDAFYFLGRIAERRGDDETALRLYARVEEGDNVLAAMLHAAAILRRGGSVPDSDRLLDGLLLDAPSRAPQIIAARAQIHADDEEARRALALVEAALVRYPDNFELHLKRAEMLERSDDLRAALRELGTLERRRPGDPTAMNALGYTLADHAQQLPRARRLIEAALLQAPQSAAIRDSLGWVLYRQGQAREALPHLVAAFAVDRGAETGAHLGEVLWALDQHEEAHRVWEQASLDDPRDRVLRSTVARLTGGR